MTTQAGEVAEAPPTPDVRPRDDHLGRDFVAGLLLIAVMTLIKVGVEHTAVGHSLERAGYDWLQRRLSAGSVPVAVVDIAGLKKARFNLDGQTRTATPREELRRLLEAAAGRRAKAVAVDIDFSQELDGSYVTPRDPEFFQFCLDLSGRTGVPIFLGIKRTESSPPKLWLGSEDYARLAANITIPKTRPVAKMPKWIRPGEGLGEGPTMGAALSGGFQISQSRLLGWLHRRKLVEQVHEKELGHGVGVGEFAVDYSPLESLVRGRLLAAGADAISQSGDLLRDKIVLIGDGTPCPEGDCAAKNDCFMASGRAGCFPGVYLHASAAYTLANAPLYELTWSGRLGIDALLALAVLLSVTGIRLFFIRRRGRTVSAHRLQIFFTVLVAAAAFVVGVLFVGTTRLMWSDFIMVLLAMALHPLLEHLFGWARRRFPLNAAWLNLKRDKGGIR